MWIKKIKINNFRNYKSQEINLEKNINIFYGENAQGKTNIIEAIFLSSMGKSFRAKKDKEMIMLGEEKSNIEIEYEKTDQQTGGLREGNHGGNPGGVWRQSPVFGG